MGVVAIVEAVVGLLVQLFQVAPDVVKAITGGQSPEEALEAARKAIEATPISTGPGGVWTRDTERRLRADDGEIDPRVKP